MELIKNPNFDLPWAEKESHDVIVLDDNGLFRTKYGNVFTPPYWTTFTKDIRPYAQIEARQQTRLSGCLKDIPLGWASFGASHTTRDSCSEYTSGVLAQ